MCFTTDAVDLNYIEEVLHYIVISRSKLEEPFGNWESGMFV